MRRVAGAGAAVCVTAPASQSPPAVNQWPESQHVQRSGHDGPVRREARSGRRHEVAVLALPHVVAFELGLPHRFLGGAVDDDGRPLYRVRTCTVDGGPVRTSAHYAVLPDHDASILRTAATIVDPGHRGRAAGRRGAARPDGGRRAGRPPPGRPAGVDLHRRVRARRRRRARRAARDHALDAHRAVPHLLPRGAARSGRPLRRRRRRAHLRRATRPGSTCCLHLVRRDHGAEVANRVARRNVVAPWRDGGPVAVQPGPTRRADAGRPAPDRAGHPRRARLRPRPPRRAAAPAPARRRTRR